MISNYKFSLLELTIVLAIMAVAASVTISMVEDVNQQPRVDRTYKIGKAVQQVVSSDGTHVSRFIADMGRLPKVINANNVLAELSDSTLVDSNVKWSAGNSYDFTAHPWLERWATLPGGGRAAGDLDFVVPCGWNGPYLYNGQKNITDGWGCEWRIQSTAGGSYDVASVNDTIYGMQSLGADITSGGSSWAETDLEFQFTEEFTKAKLTVNVLVKDDRSGNIFIAPVESTEATWQADHVYAVGDVIKLSHSPAETNDGYLFECVEIMDAVAGKSGSSEPSWGTLSGEVTTDSDLAWEYVGKGDGSKVKWTTSSIYGVGREIENSTGTERFRCKYIVGHIPKSGATEPTWDTTMGTKTVDNDIVWKRLEDNSRLNRLRVAVFVPDVSTTARNVKRIMAAHDGDILSGELLENSTVVNSSLDWDSYNTVSFSGLSVGERKLYAYGFYETSGTPTDEINRYGSSIMTITLKPGTNHLTVYLTRKLD